MQAKDMDDRETLATIKRLSMEPLNSHGDPWWSVPHWVFIWDLEAAYPGIPRKVIQAKMAKLIGRKLLDGCPCGCRGDYELTAVGEALLAAPLATT